MVTETWLDKIKYIMEKNQLTQQKLAEQVGVTRAQIGHYLNGRRVPPMHKQKLLADALGISLDELYKETTKKKPPVRYVPLVNWEHACNPKKAVDDLESDIIYLPVSPAKISKNVFALTINNDAMRSSFPGEKSFLPGEKIIIDPEKEPKNGSYVIVVLDKENSAILRQYIEDGSRKYLKPLNTQYPTVEMSKNVRFLGCAIGKLDINL